MIPLNDEWMCWPPESLDSFFQTTVIPLDENKPTEITIPENEHEKKQNKSWR